MNIFVGNLANTVTDEQLTKEFSLYGKIKSVKIIRDIFSGESKGFGFVEMQSNTESQEAINALNLKDLNGKKITVNEARPKSDNRRSGGSGGRGHSGNSGFGYRR